MLDRNGWQIEHYPVSEIHNLPLERGLDKNGKEVTISIRLIDRELFAAVWVLWVGNVPLLLLDTEIRRTRRICARFRGGSTAATSACACIRSSCSASAASRR